MSENIKILADRQDIVAVADAVRAKTGTTTGMTLGGMVSAINGIEVSSDPVLQSKTVTPTTSTQTVTADSGYDGLDTVTVNAMPAATQATPSISVSSSGLITASATQTAGYVAAGTKSATKQLTTQAAKTITPSTSSQTAVASGRYTTGAVTVAAIPNTYVKPTTTKAAATYTPGTSNQTIAAGTYCSGAQTIKGDANLTAANIAEGVSIFGVTGTHSGGSGESEDVTDETTTYTEKLTTLGASITALEQELKNKSAGTGNLEEGEYVVDTTDISISYDSAVIAGYICTYMVESVDGAFYPSTVSTINSGSTITNSEFEDSYSNSNVIVGSSLVILTNTRIEPTNLTNLEKEGSCVDIVGLRYKYVFKVVKE